MESGLLDADHAMTLTERPKDLRRTAWGKKSDIETSLLLKRTDGQNNLKERKEGFITIVRYV